jgi:hypothetical protein
MSPRSQVSMPIHELVTLLEASLLFVIQLLIARHPDLLAAPEEVEGLRPDPPLYGARRILAAVRELNNALDNYRAVFHQLPRSTPGRDDDDIPFP